MQRIIPVEDIAVAIEKFAGPFYRMISVTQHSSRRYTVQVDFKRYAVDDEGDVVDEWDEIETFDVIELKDGKFRVAGRI